MSHVTRHARDVTRERDSDTPGLGGRGVTITRAPTDDSKLMSFRSRFGAILAGMTADQQAKFEREMLGGAA